MDELIAHALNSDDTILSSPEILKRTDRLINNPQQHYGLTPKRPERKKKRKCVLSPLFNETKRISTPCIDTIFAKDSHTPPILNS